MAHFCLVNYLKNADLKEKLKLTVQKIASKPRSCLGWKSFLCGSWIEPTKSLVIVSKSVFHEMPSKSAALSFKNKQRRQHKQWFGFISSYIDYPKNYENNPITKTACAETEWLQGQTLFRYFRSEFKSFDNNWSGKKLLSDEIFSIPYPIALLSWITVKLLHKLFAVMLLWNCDWYFKNMFPAKIMSFFMDIQGLFP